MCFLYSEQQVENFSSIYQRYVDFAVDIIKACIVLHDFVRDQDGFSHENITTITGFEDLPGESTARGGLQANTVGNILSKYILTAVGAVPWQMTKI
ncbi:hypothetical protein AVEN_185546-1 [Araneus ventricosus]|uniref:Uncharacterized protein n=1 Tax=Araneus ventricosus TaxID=182803 RepID=A0A4Y2NRM7_ARAVE|nr:hypothetical protein AVEN_185546-1 [Araneus ventricosus]